jgi:hypothetical protein
MRHSRARLSRRRPRLRRRKATDHPYPALGRRRRTKSPYGLLLAMAESGAYLCRERSLIFDFPHQGVEAMTGPSPGTCNLRWQELLSQEEILSWGHHQQRPKHLSKELA